MPPCHSGEHFRSGSDFAVMGMHFKLGLYEHQSAGALQARCANQRRPQRCETESNRPSTQGLIENLRKHPELAVDGAIESISIRCYEARARSHTRARHAHWS